MFAAGRIAIADDVVRHTVHDIMVQEQRVNLDCSCVRMFESHEATRRGVQAFNDGVNIIFAPGVFQPGTDNGRALIKQQLNLLLPPTQFVPNPAPVPVPSPNMSSSASAAPQSAGVMVSFMPSTPNPLGSVIIPSQLQVLQLR